MLAHVVQPTLWACTFGCVCSSVSDLIHISNMYNSTVGQHQTKPDDLAELHSTFQLECDEQETGDVAQADSAAPAAPVHDSTACQQQIQASCSRLCSMVEDDPDMQLHLLSYVNKTEGALARIKASNIAGTAHPMAPRLSKVQDSWGNSVVRKRTIGLEAKRKVAQPTPASQPVQAEAAPFTKLQPARKKSGPRQQARVASALTGQENSSAAVLALRPASWTGNHCHHRLGHAGKGHAAELKFWDPTESQTGGNKQDETDSMDSIRILLPLIATMMRTQTTH